ncbi:MAG: hypothetical protein IIX55_00865, partial [Muribaculaceae bacterium]|nr:hypothetical protein [Muribaculaceae bacterium]
MIRSVRHIFRLASLCVVVLTMVGSLSSCRRYAGDEATVGSALAVADSLRYDSPEAAKSIIRSLNADSLGSRANAALYSVLANEVNIYGDQVAAADSLADIATDYYRMRRWQSERNRYLYARALIEKANVSVDCKDYKKAIEIISDVRQSVDVEYYDLIAKSDMVLARISSVKNESPSVQIKMLKDAVDNYRRAGLKYMQAEALNTLGAMYRIVHDMDSAFYYLSEAGVMIDSLDKPELKAANLAYIAGSYFLNSEYDKAISTAQRAISVADNSTDMSEPKYVVCKSYLSKNDLDSAMIMLRDVKFDTLVPKEKLMHLSIMLSIAKVKEDYKSALDYQEKINVITYEIKNASQDESMLSIKNKYEKTKLEVANSQLYIWLMVMLIIVIIMVGIIFYRRSRFKHDLLQQELLVAELQQSITMLQQKHSAGFMPKECSATTDADVSRTRFNEVYRRYLEVFGKIRELSDFISSDSNNLNLIKKMVSSLADDKVLSQDFISEVRTYVNTRHDNVLERLRASHPNIKDDDIDLMALMLAGYNTSMIVICMGYAD